MLFIFLTCLSLSTTIAQVAQDLAGLLLKLPSTIDIPAQSTGNSRIVSGGVVTVTIGTQGDLTLTATSLTAIEVFLGTQATITLEGPIIALVRSGVQSTTNVHATDLGVPFVRYPNGVQTTISFSSTKFEDRVICAGIYDQGHQSTFQISGTIYTRGSMISQPTSPFDILGYKISPDATADLIIAAIGDIIGMTSGSQVVFIELESNLMFIIIGVVVVVIAVIIGLLVWCCLRGKKSRDSSIIEP